MSFSDKQALIIGGSSGMGLETARLLVHAGASVTIVGRSLEKLKTARETFDVPDKVNTYRCDLTVKDELDGLLRHVRDKMESVKYLVNAAGVFAPKAFLEHADEDYDAYIDRIHSRYSKIFNSTPSKEISSWGSMLLPKSNSDVNKVSIRMETGRSLSSFNLL